MAWVLLVGSLEGVFIFELGSVSLAGYQCWYVYQYQRQY